MKADRYMKNFLNKIKILYSDQPEFLQSTSSFFSSLIQFLRRNESYLKYSLLERMIEPERIIQFRVCWINDKGIVKVNTAWRIQFNSSIGPFKGGVRFHPSVNLSILKFLAFNQVFKNSLISIPMGGGKGGSNFNPKNKSELEIMRFCQSMMTELHRHIGHNIDIPAGDIGVGEKEIGFMYGITKKLLNNASCCFTGKSLNYGGSFFRKEATGYGLVYFLELMLKQHGIKIEGKKVSVSGSGNVALHAIEKCILMGAKVISASDSDGTVIDSAGFNLEKINQLKKIKKENKRIKIYAEKFKLIYLKNQNPWSVPTEIALPCATQNEIRERDAYELIKNGVIAVAEGANMPVTKKAIRMFIESNVIFGPGKAANAGGVAVSGLEISQNSSYINWDKNEVEDKLKDIMYKIHQSCVKYGKIGKKINYTIGANTASFIKVANAMLEQGIY
ncbi:glutamate dehydrogenase [Candidatus Riesia sp. GBBU]|nr:glutamate dehydrogenase [Candidatus Riesia sp. GBBU]ARC55081.1 glutamate dehydrogenase [Candidatus Riesia sp. GBBU]